jgi:curved DNA-binding protein CbpA
MSVPGHPTDYYHVFQVCSTATDDEIRRGYKDLARVIHPDKNLNDPTAIRAVQFVCFSILI